MKEEMMIVWTELHVAVGFIVKAPVFQKAQHVWKDIFSKNKELIVHKKLYNESA